jgi:hypothetical protein
MPIPFFPKTTKHPGDRVVLPKYPASFFAGLSTEVFEGKVGRDGKVKWIGAQPDNYATDRVINALIK